MDAHEYDYVISIYFLRKKNTDDVSATSSVKIILWLSCVHIILHDITVELCNHVHVSWNNYIYTAKHRVLFVTELDLHNCLPYSPLTASHLQWDVTCYWAAPRQECYKEFELSTVFNTNFYGLLKHSLWESGTTNSLVCTPMSDNNIGQASCKTVHQWIKWIQWKSTFYQR